MKIHKLKIKTQKKMDKHTYYINIHLLYLEAVI